MQWVGPHRARHHAAISGHAVHAVDCVLVGVFRVQGFSLFEAEQGVANTDGLAAGADQVHFYAPLWRVIKSTVRKLVQLEVGTQLLTKHAEQYD